MRDEGFGAGGRLGLGPFGERGADAFDGRRGLRGDAQGRRTGRGRLQLGVGRLERHAG